MSQWLKQSTAYTFRIGPFVDSTDGFTPETALTIAYTSCLISKAGAAFAAKNDTTNLTSTGTSEGYYTCVLNTTDTGTLGTLRVHIYVSGALPVWHDFMVVPANVFESLVAGTEWLEASTLRNDVTIGGSTITVKKTDGSTTQYTKTGTFTAGADVLTGLD
jgi:hypothetical protein